MTNIIRVGFRDHNPLVIEWIVRICGQHLREVVDGLHVIHEELNSFVVASGAEGTPNKAANANVAKLKAEDEPMEAEDTASMEEEECWSEAKESLEEEKPGTKGGWKRLFLSHFGKLLLECRRYVKYNLISYTAYSERALNFLFSSCSRIVGRRGLNFRFQGSFCQVRQGRAKE